MSVEGNPLPRATESLLPQATFHSSLFAFRFFLKLFPKPIDILTKGVYLYH